MTSHATEAPSPRSWNIPALVLAVLLPLGVLRGYYSLLELDNVPEKSEAALSLEAELDEAEPDVLFVGSSQLGRGVDLDQLARELDSDLRFHSMWRSSMSAPHMYAMLANRALANDHHPKVVFVVGTLDRLLESEVENDLRLNLLREQMGDFEPVLAHKVFGREKVDPRFGLITQRRAELQDDLMNGLKGLTVGLFFGGGGEEAKGSLVERGLTRADAAMADLFGGEEAKDMDAHRSAIPIVDAINDTSARTVAGKGGLDESLVPDFIDLADEHGFKIVFATVPVAANAGRVEPDTERAFIEYVNERGAGYIDLADLKVSRTQFRDVSHLNERGAKVYTSALAAEISRLDLLNADAEVPGADIPLELQRNGTWARTGELPQLPPASVVQVRVKKAACGWALRVMDWEPLGDDSLRRLGFEGITPVRVLREGQLLQPYATKDTFADTCAGASAMGGGAIKFSAVGSVEDPETATYTVGLDPSLPVDTPSGPVWWLYPGTEAVLTLEELPFDGAVTLRAAARAPKGEEAKAGLAQILLPDGQALALKGKAGKYAAESELSSVAEGPVELRIRVPADGPFLVLESLFLSQGEEIFPLVGGAPAEEADAAQDAVGAASLGNVVSILPKAGSRDFVYAAPPPEVTWEGKVVPQKEGGGRTEVPSLTLVSSTAVRARTLLRDLSPLEITEGGEALVGGMGPCREARGGTKGAWCHNKHVVFFMANDGGAVDAPGRDFGVRLVPNRATRVGQWLYSGDLLKIELVSGKIKGLKGPAQGLRIGGVGFGGPQDEEGVSYGEGLDMTVRILDGTKVLMESTVPLTAWTEQVHTLPFEEPLALEGTVVIELQLPEGAWFFMRSMELLD